jgi:hypothetical protein
MSLPCLKCGRPVLEPGLCDRCGKASYHVLILLGEEILEGYTVEAGGVEEAAREALRLHEEENGSTPALTADVFLLDD